MTLQVGDTAPDFSLVADNGKPFKLSSKIKDKMLLVFYPGDGTPVCTKQFCDYRDGAKDLEGLGVEVIGISANDVDSHKKFKKDYNLPFTLLSDNAGEVSQKYDVLGWFGVKRALFLVNKKMEIKYRHIESVSVFRKPLSDLKETLRKVKD